jgi:uncharacterized protein
MASDGSDAGRLRSYTAVKLLVTGGFGVGKTTMIGAVSETAPLHTEELLTELGHGVDDLTHVDGKTTTTVSLDFGRITIDSRVILYLFGTPGQERFWFMWDELAIGTLAAVVLVDTRRLSSCFAAIDFLEDRKIPFIVAVNRFDGARRHGVDSVRRALHVDPATPVMACDARERESAKDVLITLLEHVAGPDSPVSERVGRRAGGGRRS